MEYKQVILVREDLKLSRGKLAAQVAHAAVATALKSSKEQVSKWLSSGMPKIVLRVANEAELKRYKQIAAAAGLVVELITDAGHTQIAPGTVTCLGIGPDVAEKIDWVTGKLKLVN